MHFWVWHFVSSETLNNFICRVNMSLARKMPFEFWHKLELMYNYRPPQCFPNTVLLGNKMHYWSWTFFCVFFITASETKNIISQEYCIGKTFRQSKETYRPYSLASVFSQYSPLENFKTKVLCFRCSMIKTRSNVHLISQEGWLYWENIEEYGLLGFIPQ